MLAQLYDPKANETVAITVLAQLYDPKANETVAFTVLAQLYDPKANETVALTVLVKLCCPKANETEMDATLFTKDCEGRNFDFFFLKILETLDTVKRQRTKAFLDFSP